MLLSLTKSWVPFLAFYRPDSIFKAQRRGLPRTLGGKAVWAWCSSWWLLSPKCVFRGLPQACHQNTCLPPRLHPCDFPPAVLIAFHQQLLCSYFSSLNFPLPALRSGRQRGSVLIWPGYMSGDNGRSTDTYRPCSVPSREPRQRFSTVLLIGESKQEADKKAAEFQGCCFEL